MAVVVIALLSQGCRCGPGGESDSVRKEVHAGQALSAKAEAFLKAVAEDLSEFCFNVSYWDHEAGTSVGVAFTTDRPTSSDISATQIDGSEALAITRYFAHCGMLDKTDVPPPGEPLAGWNVSLWTRRASAFWYLGREKAGLLNSQELMGVRAALTGDAREAWDRFVQTMRSNQSQPASRPDR